MRLFDTVLITASSERQAEAFRALLARRIEHGLYPREISFEVVADPPGGRVGTGGATLWALDRLLQLRGARDAESFLAEKRILLVHAGGESRRLPCYAPEGKLFAPLPLPSSSLLPPVVLDVQLGLFFKYPWRRGEIVVSSGDVVIDFDTSYVPAERGPVFGFAKPASVEQGSRHGVFRFDRRRERVVDYFQKAAPEVLTADALIEGTGECAMDVGLVSLSPSFAGALLELARLPAGDDTLLAALAHGRLSFDLYLEVLTACLTEVSFETFWKRVAAASGLPQPTARGLYEALHRFGLGGTITRSTLFEHVGSLAELPRACRSLISQQLMPFYEPDGGEIRPQQAGDRIVHDSVDVEISQAGPAPVLVASCSRSSLRLAGDNLVVGLEELALPFEVPRGFMVDGRALEEGRVVVMLSAQDSLKPVADPRRLVFCGQPLDSWLRERGLASADVFAEGQGRDLAEARLFCVDPSSELLAGFLSRPADAWTREFRAARRLSLAEIQSRDDVSRREDRRVALRRELLRERIRSGKGWRAVSVRDFTSACGEPGWRPLLERMLERTDDVLLRAYRDRLLRAVGDATPARPSEVEYVPRGREPAPLRPGLKQDQIVWARAPVRLDLAGGWTDTPPYTLRHGGRVVNLAVDLNGQPPVQVFCRRTAERHVRVHSIDLGHSETFTSFDELRQYGDPVSAFALPKAALCLMGLDATRERGATLVQVLEAMGTGLEITLLCAVPKGSGLGTSSILGAAILAALARFFGQLLPLDDLIRQVLQLEQMLTTGGGWQDQIGGVVSGIKCIESRAGLRPQPVVHQLDPFLFQDRDSLACFTLFYTGLTRLAKNILAEVVDEVNGADKAYQFTLRHMAQLALDAKDAIERRDRDALADVLALSWAANKRIHPSTSNDEVEELLAATRAHVRGAKLLGAGGGGYALFLSPDRVQAERTRDVLRRQFEDERARLVDFSLSRCGLEVSVS